MVRVHFSPPQVALCWVTQILYADYRGYTNKIEPQEARFCEYNVFLDGRERPPRRMWRIRQEAHRFRVAEDVP